MKRISWIMVLFLVSVFSVHAMVSEQLTEEEQLVVLQQRVQQKQQANEVPSVQKGAEYAADFAVACKAFLNTFDEGTEITIERLNQFMGTSAGKFTVALIGWRVLGQDAMNIFSGLFSTVLGIILLIPYMFFIKGILQYFVTGKRVLKSQEGKIKTYEWSQPRANALDSEPYEYWGMFVTVAAIAYTIILCILIF